MPGIAIQKLFFVELSVPVVGKGSNRYYDVLRRGWERYSKNWVSNPNSTGKHYGITPGRHLHPAAWIAISTPARI